MLEVRQAERILSQLREYQVAPTFELIKIMLGSLSAVDLSSCGIGKTYIAQAVAKVLALPTLVICPKIAVTAWAEAGRVLENSVDVIGYEKLRTGRTPYGWWDNPMPPDADREYFQCLNCQQKVTTQTCYCHHAGIHCVEVKKKPWNYGKFNFHPGVKLSIFDEVHRCGAMDSLNAEMLIATKRQKIKMLGLSATAACNPLHMRGLGYVLDLHNDKTTIMGVRGKHDFFSWARKYGCRRDPRFKGFKWLVGEAKQREVMREIRDSIIPSRGVRVSTKDIPGFPACQITAELYDIEEANKINRLYDQMADALEELAKVKQDDKCPDHPLTKILRARQEIELLKVPAMVELCNDYVEKGLSVACFVNFKQTIRALAERLKTACIVDGEHVGAIRDAAIAMFQCNQEHRILVNAAAGCESMNLHDLHGRQRVGLVMPVQSANVFRQIAGRLPRNGGLSPALYRVLFAAETYETKMQKSLRSKLNNLDCLNDGDLNPSNLCLE